MAITAAEPSSGLLPAVPSLSDELCEPDHTAPPVQDYTFIRS